MKIINSGKSSDHSNLVNVRIHKVDEKAVHLYVNDAHVLSVVLEGNTKPDPSGNVVSIQQGRQSRGLYISKHFCPDEILKALTGDEEKDMALLQHAFVCFQNVYCANNTNYAFLKESYHKMLQRFFVTPQTVARMGKGPDLTHYFMELPEDYQPYDEN